MIKLTKINGSVIYINPDLINNFECNPNTIIHMTTGEKLIVKENPEEIVNIIVEFKRRIFKDKP